MKNTLKLRTEPDGPTQIIPRDKSESGYSVSKLSNYSSHSSTSHVGQPRESQPSMLGRTNQGKDGTYLKPRNFSLSILPGPVLGRDSRNSIARGTL